jgi:hypothetical protein
MSIAGSWVVVAVSVVVLSVATALLGRPVARSVSVAAASASAGSTGAA